VAERRFVVEGPQALREALGAGGLRELFLTGGHEELTALAGQAGVPVTLVTDAVLGAMAGTVTPQGVLGTAELLDVELTAALAGRPRLVAVLHEVADPGNAGTVLRTADAAGAGAVLLTGSSVDPHNAKCVRASAGSLWHLATSGSSRDDLDDLLDGGVLAAPTAWLFGTEAQGLSTAALAAADRQVRIPLHGRAESLNLAAAAAVCLYASAREHRHVQ